VTPNPSFERTCPGKSRQASHIKRLVFLRATLAQSDWHQGISQKSLATAEGLKCNANDPDTLLHRVVPANALRTYAPWRISGADAKR
jgi:hypothetical protein